MTAMTLNDYYLYCDDAHRELYSALLYDWQETGLTWTCEDKVLNLGVMSVVKDQMLTFFSLHAGSAIPASIQLNITDWRRYLGQEDMAAFVADVRRIQGLQIKERGDVLKIENVAHALQPIQKEFKNLLHHFAVQLPNKVAV